MYFEIESEEQFELFTTKSHLCIVDFHAKWCGPCKRVSPEIQDKITSDSDFSSTLLTPSSFSKNEDLHGKTVFIKVDVDKFENYAQAFNVSGLPFFVVFKNGKLQNDNFVGGNSDAVHSLAKKFL